MRRTVCIQDERSRRARYGRIQPMESQSSLLERLTRLLP
jgi:hypothetical protein